MTTDTIRFVLIPAPVVWRNYAFDDARTTWHEEEHPRDKTGEFSKGGGQGGQSREKSPGKSGQAAKPPGQPSAKSGQSDVKLTKTTERAWSGQQQNATKLGKLAAGDLGEKIVVAWLKTQGMADAQPLNTRQSNFPVDLVGDHQVVEVKTGQVSNSKSAQQWRATIGQPGKEETALLAAMGKEEKAAHNEKKNQAIMARKWAIVKAKEQELGHKITPKTVTVILNPDTNTADLFQFEGFHRRIAYNSDQAQKAYIGSFRYDQPSATKDWAVPTFDADPAPPVKPQQQISPYLHGMPPKVQQEIQAEIDAWAKDYERALDEFFKQKSNA